MASTPRSARRKPLLLLAKADLSSIFFRGGGVKAGVKAGVKGALRFGAGGARIVAFGIRSFMDSKDSLDGEIVVGSGELGRLQNARLTSCGISIQSMKLGFAMTSLYTHRDCSQRASSPARVSMKLGALCIIGL